MIHVALNGQVLPYPLRTFMMNSDKGSSTTTVGLRRLGSLVDAGRLLIAPNHIDCWYPRSAADCRQLTWITGLSAVGGLEATIWLLGVESGPGLNLGLLRLGACAFMLLALLPMACTRRTVFDRDQPKFLSQLLLMGGIPLKVVTPNLEDWNVLQVSPIRRRSASELGQDQNGDTITVVLHLTSISGRGGIPLIRGSKESVLALTQLLILRMPTLHLRVLC